MTDFVSGVGPLFGPDFVEVTVNDETGQAYSLQVYPDAHNPELKVAGLPTQYYFQPSRVYLAKKQDSPQDFDFGMTVFKGLMTSETTVGVQDGSTSNGDVEAGGGFCSFSTTFAIPDSVIAGAIQKLKASDHPAPAGRLQIYFNHQPQDPDPRLGIVPITESNVVIAVPDLVKASAGTKSPMFISAQTTGKGSIEEHGYSSFLVTCNQLAAGAIAGSIENGVSPFTVTNQLKESFYINGVTATVNVDVDKVYQSFSAAVSVGGFLGIDSFSASAAYSDSLVTGGVTTQIDENGSVLTPELKKWIEDKVDDMRKTAMDLVKEYIFDWDPSKTDSKASTDRGWFSSIFGGATVSVKSSYEHREAHFKQTIILNETIAVDQTISGDLNDLEPAVKAHPEKYLAIVDIGEHFKKVQVAATCAINFGQKLADGTDLRDPITSVQLEAGYPDYSQPLGADGSPNLHILGEGFHYTLASKDPNGGVEPVIWTVDNAKDICNLAWLRLETPVGAWPSDQVKLRRKIIYNSDDPRVNFSPAISAKSDAGVVVELEEMSTDHTPVLTSAAVGYVYVHFLLDRLLPKSNITVTLTPTIGGDTYAPLVVTSANQKNVIWEVFSDKYFNASEFTYTVDIEIVGGGFTDTPVSYSSAAPIIVPVAPGRLKYLNPSIVRLPSPPQDKVSIINGYIIATPS